MINFPGPDKLLLLAIIALVVLGPTRLPQAARTAGKWIGELRKLTARFQDEVSGALGDPKDAITAAVGDLRNEVGSWRSELSGLGRSVTSAVPTTAATASSSWANGNGAGPSANGSHEGAAVPGTTPPTSVSLPPVPDDPSLN